MEDDEFLHNLKAFTGDDAAWDGFDPTAWRSVDSVDGQPGGLGSATDEPDESDAYESDDSAEMILNLHKLTPDEKRRAGKLNKAREYASIETGFPRELAELEKVEWKETGLANGAVSAEGDRFVALRLVESYPDMFVGKANGVRVSAQVPKLGWGAAGRSVLTGHQGRAVVYRRGPSREPGLGSVGSLAVLPEP